MSEEHYLKSLNERLKKLDNPSALKLFNQWSYNYLIHSKSIHQYSPEIHILLLKYSIHLIYILSKVHPELSNKIKQFFSDNGLELNKIEKLSNNFDPDKYCIFEDFTNFIAKTFEAVENEYKEKIINIKEFSDYAQIISVYKLLVDLIDMVEIWKEKDEGLKKFQNLCKFRVVQVVRAKKDYENSPEAKEYEKEVRSNQNKNNYNYKNEDNDENNENEPEENKYDYTKRNKDDENNERKNNRDNIDNSNNNENNLNNIDINAIIRKIKDLSDKQIIILDSIEQYKRDTKRIINQKKLKIQSLEAKIEELQEKIRIEKNKKRNKQNKANYQMKRKNVNTNNDYDDEDNKYNYDY